MKTALQELLDDVKAYRTSGIGDIIKGRLIEKITDLQFKEKNQIEDAYKAPLIELLKYENILRTDSFECWSEDAKDGYLTALSSIKARAEKLLQKNICD